MQSGFYHFHNRIRIIMTKAKLQGRRKRNPPRSPVKDYKIKPASFGRVKDLGQVSLENIEKRSVLKFLRKKNPD